jgi:hypothetical protein
MTRKLSMETSRKRLAVLWFAGAGVVFLTLLAQTLAGRYADKAEQAWGWMLPTVVPTLSLIVGVLAISARRPAPSASPTLASSSEAQSTTTVCTGNGSTAKTTCTCRHRALSRP